MIRLIRLVWLCVVSTLSFVSAQKHACELRVATVTHFHNPYGLSHLVTPVFQKQSHCRVRYITFRNQQLLCEALPSLLARAAIDVVVGLLDEDFHALNTPTLSKPKVYAFSAISLIYRKDRITAHMSLAHVLQTPARILVTHPATSRIGLTWQQWSRHLPTQAKLIFYPQWDLAYQAFLNGQGDAIVSYTSSLRHLYQHYNPKHYAFMEFADGHPQHHYACAYALNSAQVDKAQSYVDILLSPAIQERIPEIDIMYPARDPDNIIFRMVPLPRTLIKLPNDNDSTPLHVRFWQQLPRILCNTAFLGVLVTFCSLVWAIMGGLALYVTTESPCRTSLGRTLTSLPYALYAFVMMMPSVLAYSSLKMLIPNCSGFLWLLISMTWLESMIVSVLIHAALKSIPPQQVHMANALKLSFLRRFHAIVLPHLHSVFSPPLLMTMTILNGLHVTPFLFDAANDWFNLNAYLFHAMNQGLSTPFLLGSMLSHMTLAFMIVRVQGNMLLLQPQDNHTLFGNFTASIRTLSWLSLCLWVAPVGLALVNGIPAFMGAAHSTDLDLLSEAFLTTLSLTLCGIGGGLILVLLSVTLTIRSRKALSFMSFFATLLLIAPLFLLARLDSQGDKAWLILVCAHVILVWGWAWRYLSSIIAAQHRHHALTLRTMKLTWAQTFRGVVWPALQKPFVDFLPIFIAISIGEVLLISSLPTVNLMTLPSLLLAAVQKYRFAEASGLLLILFFTCLATIVFFQNMLLNYLHRLREGQPQC